MRPRNLKSQGWLDGDRSTESPSLEDEPSVHLQDGSEEGRLGRERMGIDF